MNSVNKTLYIPLYGKAFVSKKGLFLDDKKAEEIWNAEKPMLSGKAKSKWLAYYMGIRSAVFDDWLRQRIAENEQCTIIHIGCGLDSRVLRVGCANQTWYDVDFFDVIEERKLYYSQTDHYKMIAKDVREDNWLENIPETKCAIVVMEGVSMYLSIEQLRKLTTTLCAHFEKVSLLMDCYTTLAVKISKIKNPVKTVGVDKVFGLDKPELLQQGNFVYQKEHSMTPQKYVDELHGMEKFIFSKLYAGSLSKKLYRLFEYRKI